MSPVVVLTVLAGLVALATVLGLLWQRRQGRVTRAHTGALAELPEVQTGSTATLLQFSTAVCAPCGPTRRVLRAVASEREGVLHVDLDLTDRPELASRFRILSTPTTLVLDAEGVVRARISGAPRPDAVRTELDRLIAA